MSLGVSKAGTTRAYQLLGTTTITSTGAQSYTIIAGTVYVEIEMWGAGGGGGRGNVISGRGGSTHHAAGGGGASVWTVIPVVSLSLEEAGGGFILPRMNCNEHYLSENILHL